MADYNEINGVEGVDDIINGVEQEISGLGAVNRNRLRSRITNYANRAKNTRSSNLLMNERTSPRAWFEETKHLLPPDLLARINNKEMQVSDTMIYSIKDASGQSHLELMKSGDAQAEGITNINKAQLEKDEMFLLCGVVVLYGTRAAGAAVETTEFGTAYPAALRQGRIKITVGEVPIVHDYAMPLELVNLDRTDLRKFYFPLAVPKWIKDQKVIKPELYTPTALPADTAIKLCFIGVQLKAGSPQVR